MSQSGSERAVKAIQLLDTITNDALASSASEIRDEITANDGEPQKILAEMRQMTLGLILQSRKSRLQHAQIQLRQHSNSSSSLSARYPARIRERLRQLVSKNEAFANGRIALAFRNGTAQSDNDILGLWEDLIDIGAVTDDELRD